MGEIIHKTYLKDKILVLEIDNPPANTLSKKIKNQFGEVLDEIEADKKLRAIIISGRGENEALENAKRDDGILTSLRSFGKVIARFENLPIPTIAACNGWTIGGGLELALCTDIRLGAESARFKGVAVNIGLTASGSRLPKIIGVARAKHMLLTADVVDAETALNYGLITAIHPDDQLLEEAIKLAKLIVTKAPLALKSTKKIINLSQELSENEMNFLGQNELEELSKTKDYKTALIAFANKQTPKFEGK